MGQRRSVNLRKRIADRIEELMNDGGADTA